MVVVGATAGITTGITAFAQRLGTSAADVITKSNPNSNKSVSNFLPDLNIDWTIFKGHVIGLDQFPLNLVQDMVVINTSAILFLFIILNVYIAITIKDSNINIFNYLPKWLDPSVNKLGKLIQFFLNRYIRIWYGSRKFILIVSWFMLLLGLLTIQLGLVLILYSG